jgi:hypothetical protein
MNLQIQIQIQSRFRQAADHLVRLPQAAGLQQAAALAAAAWDAAHIRIPWEAGDKTPPTD